MTDDIATNLKCAAATLFAEQGFSATRVADIVEKTGVAQGTFYLHFENKAAIFVALVDDFFSGLLGETLDRHPVRQLESAAHLMADIATIWGTLIEYCRRQSSLTRLVLHETHALPAGQRIHINRHFEQSADALTQYLQGVQQLGLIKNLPARFIAWLLIGLIERTMHYAILIAPDTRTEILAAHCTEFELHGLLASGPVRKGDGK